MALGRPAIPTPNRLDLRAAQDAISSARQRIEAIEAVVAQLQVAPNATASTIALLQAQVARLLTAAGSGTISPSQFGAQEPGHVLIGPVEGANAVPTFRELQWHFDLPLITSAPFTSAIEGDEAILIERYGQLLYTTLNDVIALLRSVLDQFVWLDVAGDYTLMALDAGNGIITTGTSGVQSITVPAHSDVPFDIGATVLIQQGGGAQAQIVPVSGVVMQYRVSRLPITEEEGAVVTLRYIGADRWALYGDLAP